MEVLVRNWGTVLAQKSAGRIFIEYNSRWEYGADKKSLEEQLFTEVL